MKESQENYIETIYMLSLEKSVVRAIDIVNQLGYSKPSVSRAMKLLKEKGYVMIGEEGNITLTDIGLNKAKTLYEKHHIIKQFLMMTLEISEDIAEHDACRIEHILSDSTFEKIKQKVGVVHEKK